MSNVKPFPVAPTKETLLRRCGEECAQLGLQVVFPIHLDLAAALSLIGNLQLASRHPANFGPSAELARRVIDGLLARMREAGYTAHAELAALGDDPRYSI